MGNKASADGRRFKKHPSKTIHDKFSNLAELKSAISRMGVTGKLILGYDFSKSNEGIDGAGHTTFGGNCLHDLSYHHPNPYQVAIEYIESAMLGIVDINAVTAYGFGDSRTGDTDVFTFVAQDRFEKSIRGCSLSQVQDRYQILAPYVVRGDPSSYAPIILQAVNSVIASNYAYHILVILATGQVTPPAQEACGHYSKQEQDTIEAISFASHFPLSIVVVGVGDGPWRAMEHFDNDLTQSRFDNVQFVNFDNVTRGVVDVRKRSEQFALYVLMEIPEQYRQSKHFKGRSKTPPFTVKVLTPPDMCRNGIEPPQDNQLPHACPPVDYGPGSHAPQKRWHSQRSSSNQHEHDTPASSDHHHVSVSSGSSYGGLYPAMSGLQDTNNSSSVYGFQNHGGAYTRTHAPSPYSHETMHPTYPLGGDTNHHTAAPIHQAHHRQSVYPSIPAGYGYPGGYTSTAPSGANPAPYSHRSHQGGTRPHAPAGLQGLARTAQAAYTAPNRYTATNEPTAPPFDDGGHVQWSTASNPPYTPPQGSAAHQDLYGTFSRPQSFHSNASSPTSSGASFLAAGLMTFAPGCVAAIIAQPFAFSLQ